MFNTMQFAVKNLSIDIIAQNVFWYPYHVIKLVSIECEPLTHHALNVEFKWDRYIAFQL